jgi:2-polyprenyl-3-methyl-5-hydroxy-6-metoxy-1,4-benzoquinol methylase
MSDTRLESTVCPLCGSTEFRLRYRVPDALLGIPGTFTLVECCSCNLLYQNPRPGPDTIGTFYPPEYNLYIPPPWANPNLLKKLLHLYGIKKRWAFVEHHAPQRSGKRRVLDVGCATGVFLATGSDAWQKVGVELSAQAAEQARRQFGLTVYPGTLEQAPLSGQQFDVITMWDVLEHLHQPVASLMHIRELLRPDGIFVARVPNLSSYDARLCGRYWGGLEQPRHLFIPDEQTLTRMLEQAGFRVVEMVCLGSTFHVLMQSWYFWLRQHVPAGWGFQLAWHGLNNPVVQAALFPLLWVIDRKLGKGSVVTVVAQPA